MKKNKGFSLVELMVALVIGLLLVAGVIELFVNSRQMYRVQDMKARMQEDGRYAVFRISKLLSRTGYLGCNSIQSRDGSEITNTLNNADSYFWDFDVPLTGHKSNGDGSWTPALTDIPSVDTNSDVLTLRTVDELYIQIDEHDVGGSEDADVENYSAPLKIPAANGLTPCSTDEDSPNYKASCSNIVMVSDCENTAIFQVTNDPTADGTLEHVVGGSAAPGNSTSNLGATFRRGWLNTIASHSFYVSSQSGTPSLYEKVGGNNAEVVVDGVETIKVEYGIDDNNDLNVDKYVNASGVTDWSEIVSVKISLVMINTDPNQNTDVAVGDSAYFLDGIEYKPKDGRLRQVFTKTIALRNRTL